MVICIQNLIDTGVLANPVYINSQRLCESEPASVDAEPLSTTGGTTVVEVSVTTGVPAVTETVSAGAVTVDVVAGSTGTCETSLASVDFC